MYVWANNDVAKAYHFNDTTFDVTPVALGTIGALAIPGTSSDSVPRAPVNGIQIVPR